jgi:Transglutaminase-like superfamily
MLESTLLTLRPANHERMRHDLATLTARLPEDVTDPIDQMLELGYHVGSDFTTSETAEADSDSSLLDPEPTLLRRHGDELVVAALVAAVGQRRGWEVEVICSDRRALIGHRRQGPPLVISPAHQGRVVDATDFASEGDIWWRCPHEVAYAVSRRRCPAHAD